MTTTPQPTTTDREATLVAWAQTTVEGVPFDVRADFGLPSLTLLGAPDRVASMAVEMLRRGGLVIPCRLTVRECNGRSPHGPRDLAYLLMRAVRAFVTGTPDLAARLERLSEDRMALGYLSEDDGAVPCSRYGRTGSECAPAALAVARYISDETGEPMTRDLLDHAMSLVVNDSDEPLRTLPAHVLRTLDLADDAAELRALDAPETD
jgi:hypothetical protein